MISVAFKTPLKTRLGTCIYKTVHLNRPDDCIGFAPSCPTHFTTKLRPYLHPLVTGLIQNKKFSFSKMLRRELYLWPLAKMLYHGWISTMTSSNESSWKFSPRNEELVAPLVCPLNIWCVRRWQSLNGFICEKAKALPISLAKITTLHRVAVGRNLKLRWRCKGRSMLWPREIS